MCNESEFSAGASNNHNQIEFETFKAIPRSNPNQPFIERILHNYIILCCWQCLPPDFIVKRYLFFLFICHVTNPKR